MSRRRSPVTVHHGDSRDVLKTLADNSVDSVVCDPPYALVSIVKRFGSANSAPAKGNEAYARASAGFMGQAWDTGETAFAVDFWEQVYRVLKPGGHVLAFGAGRAVHQLATAIEGAGFEIRDRIVELIACDTHVAAFMNSLTHEQQGAFLRCIEESTFGGELAWIFGTGFPKSHDVSKGIDRAAGAARKVIGLKQNNKGDSGAQTYGALGEFKQERFSEITAPASAASAAWSGWGTALKPALEPIIMARKPLIGTVAANVLTHGTGAINIDGCRIEAETLNPAGRFPANVIHDESDEVVAAFPPEAGAFARVSGNEPSAVHGSDVYGTKKRVPGVFHGDSGSAARFFYSAKADADDRLGSKHPTVKPVDLMRYLCRLVTPPGGLVLDPFAGSGSTGVAAMLEGFRAILIEREPQYVADIHRKLAFYRGEGRLAAQEKKQKPQQAAGPLFGEAD